MNEQNFFPNPIPDEWLEQMSGESSGDGGTLVAEPEIDHKLEEPNKYQVYFLNDDFTPIDFVVDLIVYVFKLSKSEAEVITQNIHENGKGVCGQFTKDIAESKVALATTAAKKMEFPLLCDLEPVDE